VSNEKPTFVDRAASGVDTVVRILSPVRANARLAGRVQAEALASFVGGGFGPLQTDRMTGEVTGRQGVYTGPGPTPRGYYVGTRRGSWVHTEMKCRYIPAGHAQARRSPTASKWKVRGNGQHASSGASVEERQKGGGQHATA
jgi:hypothetical protein